MILSLTYFILCHCYIYRHCACALFNRSFMYILTVKVRELLILCYVLLMFIDLFIDWGDPSGLTPVMLLIDLGKPYKLLVGSRTSSLPLMTAVMLVKGMASGNLDEAHIMVKRYWFLDLIFGKGPTQSIISLQNGSSNAGMSLRRAAGIFWLWFPYHLTSVTSFAKFCYTASNLGPIEMFGYPAVSFIDA